MVDDETTSFVWNGQNLASETTNNITTAYTYDPTGIIAAKTGNQQTIRYAKNPHGDIIASLQNDTIIGRSDYDAFGNEFDTTGTVSPFRYCGEYYDEETGLIYLRNRYYDTASGRFLTEDPVKDGLNWYVYCGNNPIRLFDPWGLSITLCGTDDEKKSIFEQLQLLTDDNLTLDLETGVVSYEASSDVKREISSGLVREIIDNEINCEIVVTSDKNGYSIPKFDRYGNLVSTQIVFNPDFTFSPWTIFEGEVEAREIEMPAFMILGHEMVHTIRRMQGVERDRRENGAFYLAPPIPGKSLMQIWRPEEIETTGIDYAKITYDDYGNIVSAIRIEASKFYYSENALRAEYDRVHQSDTDYTPLGRRCIY